MFKTRNGVYIKSRNSTSKMMHTIMIILVFFIVFATFKNGIYPSLMGYGNWYTTFKPLIFAAVSSAVCMGTEYLYYIIIKKRKSFFYLFEESYAIIPGMFLGITVSINTPLWLLILGSAITSLSKVMMGGFGKNKLNPSAIGGVVITILFSSFINGYLNPYEMTFINDGYNNFLSYENMTNPFGILINLLIGTFPGPCGTTSSLLCLVSLVYLMWQKLIKWRISISAILTVIIMGTVISTVRGIDGWFILFNLLSDGFLFGMILMATDPVTSPTGTFGEILGGIFLGVMMMIIRYLWHLENGVLLAILFFNIFTMLLNYLTIILYERKVIKAIVVTVILVLAFLSALLIF